MRDLPADRRSSSGWSFVCVAATTRHLSAAQALAQQGVWLAARRRVDAEKKARRGGQVDLEDQDLPQLQGAHDGQAADLAAEGLFQAQGDGEARQDADFVVFLGLGSSTFIRRLDVVPTQIFWNETGDLAASCEDFVLHAALRRRGVGRGVRGGLLADEGEGVEDGVRAPARDRRVRAQGQWVGDCFLFTNAEQPAQLLRRRRGITLFHLDRPMYLLGYLAAQNRVYLIDKQFGVVS